MREEKLKKLLANWIGTNEQFYWGNITDKTHKNITFTGRPVNGLALSFLPILKIQISHNKTKKLWGVKR